MTSTDNLMAKIDFYLQSTAKVVSDTKSCAPQIYAIFLAFIESLDAGGKIIWAGNGGSASDSQHLAAELVGRFANNRKALASLAITTDTSIITSVGNDFGFDQIFSRQIEAIGKSEDLFIGISTSGKSENILKAFKSAKSLGMKTVFFTKLKVLCDDADLILEIPSEITSHIQEAQITVGQLICGLVEDYYTK